MPEIIAAVITGIFGMLLMGFVVPRVIAAALLMKGLFITVNTLPLLSGTPSLDASDFVVEVLMIFPNTAVQSIQAASGLVDSVVAGLVMIVLAVPFLVGLWIGLFVWPELLVLRILI